MNTRFVSERKTNVGVQGVIWTLAELGRSEVRLYSFMPVPFLVPFSPSPFLVVNVLISAFFLPLLRSFSLSVAPFLLEDLGS